MFFTTLLAAICATFASALPTAVLDPLDPAYSLRCIGELSLKCKAPPIVIDPLPGTFVVTNFIFTRGYGFTWSFSLAVEGEKDFHPSVPGPLYFSGDLAKNQDYVTIAVSDTQELAAYIKRGESKNLYTLWLKYTVHESEMTKKTYYSRTTVYPTVWNPSVKSKEPIQPKDFRVRERWSDVTNQMRR